jgi:tetratricopeptide (TPR) repeat protein
VTERESANARAWSMLGSARHQTKQSERAIEAYQKSMALQPNPAAMYNTGAAYARLKNVDAAVEWLAKAKATGRVDMAQVAADSDFADISGDVHVARLLPRRLPRLERHCHPCRV